LYRRIRQDPATTVTTTTGALINAVLVSEQYINQTANRFDKELTAMSGQVEKLKTQLAEWNFHIGVLDESAVKDNALIKNNTETLVIANDTAGYKKINDTKTKYLEMIKAQTEKKDKLQKELVGVTDMSPEQMAEIATILPRINKAETAYLLNGTKMAAALANLKRVEGELKFNATYQMERILRRETDKALAEIPKEFQRQLDIAIKEGQSFI